VWSAAAGLAFVQGCQRLDLLIAEVEVEDLEILSDPLRINLFRENDIATLDMPTQYHLSRMHSE
jgi:hypothetical protein